MVTRLTVKARPVISKPASMASNAAFGLYVMARSLYRPDGPAAPGANDLVQLVGEGIFMNGEQAVFLDELIQGRATHRQSIARPGRDIVGPALATIDGAGRTHPILDAGTRKHQHNMNGRRRDDAAVRRRPGKCLIMIKWIVVTDQPGELGNHFGGQGHGFGVAQFTGNNLIPGFTVIDILPEIVLVFLEFEDRHGRRLRD